MNDQVQYRLEVKNPLEGNDTGNDKGPFEVESP